MTRILYTRQRHTVIVTQSTIVNVQSYDKYDIILFAGIRRRTPVLLHEWRGKDIEFPPTIYPSNYIHPTISIQLYPSNYIHPTVSIQLYPSNYIHPTISIQLYPFNYIRQTTSVQLYPTSKYLPRFNLNLTR